MRSLLEEILVDENSTSNSMKTCGCNSSKQHHSRSCNCDNCKKKKRLLAQERRSEISYYLQENELEVDDTELEWEFELSGRRLKDAVEFNKDIAATLGWADYYERIVKLLGLKSRPNETDFAIAVEKWQVLNQKKLKDKPDGMLGQDTLQLMQQESKIIDVSCEPELFKRGVLNVIEWGERVRTRKIPKEAGPLPIFTRGRIRIPFHRTKWLFDQIKTLRQALTENKLIDQLPPNASNMLPFVDATVELRYNRYNVSASEIKNDFYNFLLRRHKEELPTCSDQLFAFAYFPVAKYKEIQDRFLGTPIDLLFSKAKVNLPPESHTKEDYRKLYLLVYVSFPNEFRMKLAPGKSQNNNIFVHPAKGIGIMVPSAIIQLPANDLLKRFKKIIGTLNTSTSLSNRLINNKNKKLSQIDAHQKELISINDPSIGPYRFICELWSVFRAKDDQHFIAGPFTGILISPNHVLTVEHALNDNSQDDKPGLGIAEYIIANFPIIGGYKIQLKNKENIHIRSDLEMDLGLIRLNTNIAKKIINNKAFGYWGSHLWGFGTEIRVMKKNLLELHSSEIYKAGRFTGKELTDADSLRKLFPEVNLNEPVFCKLNQDEEDELRRLSERSGHKLILNKCEIFNPKNKLKVTELHKMLYFNSKNYDGMSGSPMWINLKKQNVFIKNLIGINRGIYGKFFLFKDEYINPTCNSRFECCLSVGTFVSMEMLQQIVHWAKDTFEIKNDQLIVKENMRDLIPLLD